jgi:hypothetical protein
MMVVANAITTIDCPMDTGSTIFANTIQKTAPIPKFTRLSNSRKYDPVANFRKGLLEFILNHLPGLG